MFYYEQFFRTALDGIDRSNIMPISIQIGQVILLISFLVAVYESFIRGGDVRMLGVAAVKYLALGLVLLVYAAAFRDINGMFNAFADFIANNAAFEARQRLLLTLRDQREALTIAIYDQLEPLSASSNRNASRL